MRNIYILGAAVAVSFLALHCGSESVSCEEALTCAGPGTPDGSTDGQTTDGPKPPDGCEPSADPKDAPKCVVSEFGVFVDATGGKDTNAGTKEAPFQTINGALGKLGGKTRVYVCAGNYPEHVKLTTATSIYGGFKCGDWSYDGSKPKVAPTDVGYALEVHKVNGALTVEDVEWSAAGGTEDSPSSIAAFVENTPSLTLLRTDLIATTGFHGKDQPKAATIFLMTATPINGSLNGNNANGNNGADAQLCTCVGGATSKGGQGGAKAGDGLMGETAQASPEPVLATGAGGTSAECSGANVNGRNGSNAPPAVGGTGATALGVFSELGWVPQSGQKGLAGVPGQGGGGGGGGAATGGGGGGACGGCGGEAALGGGGGGASIALMTLDSPVVVRSATLKAGTAGAGGTGGEGGDGADGGTKGTQSGGGCSGGNGGKGGKGAGGGGGAGGLSAAVIQKGTPPTITDSMLIAGPKGLKGVGGSSSGNDGIEGQSTQVYTSQ